MKKNMTIQAKGNLYNNDLLKISKWASDWKYIENYKVANVILCEF